jgi:hypothetical protein
LQASISTTTHRSYDRFRARIDLFEQKIDPEIEFAVTFRLCAACACDVAFRFKS